MSTHRLLLAAASLTALALTGCDRGAVPTPDKTVTEAAPEAAAQGKDPIASAEAAAPRAVSEKASVIAADPDGSMKVLRQGTNGFSCMPDNPVTPGPDPMCMDANALGWAMAWMKHETPRSETPGFMYMLAGGTDASNTDPFATQPTKGGDWVHTGPHVMIVGSAKALEGYPTSPQPDTSQPYVMWAGTPYAHLMIPVN